MLNQVENCFLPDPVEGTKAMQADLRELYKEADPGNS